MCWDFSLLVSLSRGCVVCCCYMTKKAEAEVLQHYYFWLKSTQKESVLWARKKSHTQHRWRKYTRQLVPKTLFSLEMRLQNCFFLLRTSQVNSTLLSREWKPCVWKVWQSPWRSRCCEKKAEMLIFQRREIESSHHNSQQQQAAPHLEP